MPQDFWDWLGSIANTIVNGLITAGQMICGSLTEDTGQSDSGGVRGGISWSVLSVGL
ncbi:MAG: hypothetical protein V3W28_03300 [Thermoplasmata archaeon]